MFNKNVEKGTSGLFVIGSATYEGKQYKLIYDEAQKIVWMDYSHPFSIWEVAHEWVGGLNRDGVVTPTLAPGVKVNWQGDWRLPKTVDKQYAFGYDGNSASGFNVTSSELGHLFYKSLGNKGFQAPDGSYPQAGKGLRNPGPFENLELDFYWSNAYSDYPDEAWFFSLESGFQSEDGTDWPFNYSVAVREASVEGYKKDGDPKRPDVTGESENKSLVVIGTATYLNQDYKLIYDKNQDLIWFDFTSDFKTWPDQMRWATTLNNSGVMAYNLNEGVSVEWAGEWRLPKTVDAKAVYGFDGETNTIGFNRVQGSEWGVLYHNSLGNLGLQDTNGELPAPPPEGEVALVSDEEAVFAAGLSRGLTNTAPFDNLLPEHYWFSTDYEAYPMKAWYVITAVGFEGVFYKQFPFSYAMAVRPGKVSLKG